MNFAKFIKEKRERLNENDKNFSLRKMSLRIGIQASYLSKLENGLETTPSEDVVKKIAKELKEDENILLAMVGKISTEVKEIILKNPVIFSQLLQQLKDQPEHAILRVVREVKDGKW